MRFRSLPFVFLVLISTQVFALEVCEADLKTLPEPKYFKDIYREAVSVGSYIANYSPTTTWVDESNARYRHFAAVAQESATRHFAGTPVAAMLSQQLDAFAGDARTGVHLNDLPTFTVVANPMTPGLYDFSFSNRANELPGSFVNTDQQCAPRDGWPGCLESMKALAAAIYPYKAAYERCSAGLAAQGAARINASWERYFDVARSQTLLDIFATSGIEGQHLKSDHLVGPMKRQWFVLHPGLVYEYLSSAPDGSQGRPGLSLELFGVNWWDKASSPIGYPFGVSITAVYVDRASVDDGSIGLMFHFDNRYSIGWSNHQGEHGVYLSIDLLHLAEEKKTQWQRYERDINKIAGRH